MQTEYLRINSCPIIINIITQTIQEFIQVTISCRNLIHLIYSSLIFLFLQKETQVTGMNKNIRNNCSVNSDLESRRSSGNSVTIKITNDNNETLDDESLENILNENYMILNEAERNRVDDFEVNKSFIDYRYLRFLLTRS